MPRQDRKLAASESISSYQDFPSRSPMRDDQFATSRSPRTVTAAPESNSRAVRSALLNLQEKIRKLEQERAEAEGNLKSLASETTHYRELMQKQQHVKQAPNVSSTRHSQELQSQLAGAESRSELLEKQLEYMRNMVRSAEQERNSALKQQELQTRQHAQVTSEEVSSQGVKLNSLEREHEQLKATQALAESKIQDLERKLKEGRHQREILQSRAAQLQTEAKCKEILAESNPSHKVKKPKKKKNPKPSGKKHTTELPSQRRVPCTSRHLRLKMENVPFIAGQATTPSHNVNVNMQNLIALMKTHNSAWCGNPSVKGRPNGGLTKTAKSRSVSVTSSDSDLSDLLLGLQDEFGQLAFEHQEITKQIQETTEHRLQEDLEQELSAICARMESKGDQISKLKRHKQKITKKTTVNAARPKPVRKVWSPSPTASAMNDGEVKVITTVKTRGKGIQVVSPDHHSQRNQCLLKNMKTLQTSLRKHDVSWD